MPDDGKVFENMLNEIMAWAFRAIIAVATTIGGWSLTRIVNSADEISLAVHSHDTKLEILNERAKETNDKLTGTGTQINDHEVRIRQLERSGGK